MCVTIEFCDPCDDQCDVVQPCSCVCYILLSWLPFSLVSGILAFSCSLPNFAIALS